MADQKISGLGLDSSLDGNHYVVLNDPAGPSTKRTLLSTIAAWLFNQDNIPSGSGSPVTRFNEMLTPAVISGLVISADSVGVNRNASMTSGTIYINGRRLSLSSVTARTYTASRDTYVDALDNLNGTASIVYTEVTNGAASPALAANSVRLGKVVTGATTIAAASSITQLGTDSLANLYSPTRLQKVSVIRQNDTTNLSKPQSIILTGWGTGAQGGAAAHTDAVVFPVTFAAIPIILAQHAGDSATAGVYGNGGNTVEGRLCSKTIAQTTTGFTYMTHTAGGTAFAAGFYYYTWIAIGEIV